MAHRHGHDGGHAGGPSGSAGGHSHDQSHGHSGRDSSGQSHADEGSHSGGHHGSHQKGPVAEHKAKGRRARCLVVTVSDSRTLENDTSGQRACDLLVEGGHEVREREIIHDDRAKITALVRAGISNPEIDAVILTGGTGVGPRDVTWEAVRDVLDRPLDGFGELFRSLSYEEIGAAAMLSRAIGGVTGQTVIFALPGSTKAVELGIRKLIAPELGHILGLIAP